MWKNKLGMCPGFPRTRLGMSETSLKPWFQDCLKCQKRCPWCHPQQTLSQLLSLVDTSNCVGMWWVRSSHRSSWKLFLYGFSAISFKFWHQGKTGESWEYMAGRSVEGPWLYTLTGHEIILLVSFHCQSNTLTVGLKASLPFVWTWRFITGRFWVFRLSFCFQLLSRK